MRKTVVGKTPSSQMVEEQLRRARGAHGEEIGKLLELYRPYLLSVAGQEIDAELQAKAGESDLVQSAILTAVRTFARFRGTSAPEIKSWLRRILLNTIDDWHRSYFATAKRAAYREQSLDDSRDLKQQLAIGYSQSPGAKLDQQDRFTSIRTAMTELNDAQRTVIQWYWLDGKELAEIAAITNRSEAAVRMLLNRAIRRLSKIMKRD